MCPVQGEEPQPWRKEQGRSCAQLRSWFAEVEERDGEWPRVLPRQTLPHKSRAGAGQESLKC